MNHKWIGLIASGALAFAGAAFAQSDTGTGSSGTAGTMAGSNQQQGTYQSQPSQTNQGQMNQGQSSATLPSQQNQQPATTSGTMSGAMPDTGQAATQGNMMQGNMVMGTVVRNTGRTLYVQQSEGAVVPLKVNHQTQFTDPSVHSIRDFKEGQQIRAAFKVKDIDNFATRITLSTELGTGGAGATDSNVGRDINNDTSGMNNMPVHPKQNHTLKNQGIQSGTMHDSSSPDMNTDSSKQRMP